MAINTTFTAGAVLTAQQMNNLPWGVVGRAQKTTDTGVSTTATDVSGLSITFTADSTRLYKLSITAFGENTGSGSYYTEALITDGSNNIKQRIRGGADNTSVYYQLSGFLYETGLSGSVTRKIRVNTNTNASNILGNAAYPFQFLIEDIGPAS